MQKSTSTGACGKPRGRGPARLGRVQALCGRCGARNRQSQRCDLSRARRARHDLLPHRPKEARPIQAVPVRDQEAQPQPEHRHYLDAGHSGWLKARTKVKMLRRAGVMNPQVRGSSGELHRLQPHQKGAAPRQSDGADAPRQALRGFDGGQRQRPLQGQAPPLREGAALQPARSRARTRADSADRLRRSAGRLRLDRRPRALRRLPPPRPAQACAPSRWWRVVRRCS